MKGKVYKAFLSLFLGLLGLAVLSYLAGHGNSTVVQSPSPTPSPETLLIDDVMLQLEDLPPGWYRKEGSVRVEYVPGGEGRYFWFNSISAQDLLWVHVSEKVLIYEGQGAAEEGYQEQKNKYFPPRATGWREIERLAFPHHADEIKVACLEGYINGIHHYTCGAVGRYERVVIVVLGNVFDDQWLSMAEFREVLEAADRRAAASVEERN